MRRIVRPAWAVGMVVALTGCAKDIVVPPTGDDVGYMQASLQQIPMDPFYIPAELQFGSILGSLDSERYRPTENFSKRGHRFEFPVYSVIRDACQAAVDHSFGPNLDRTNSIVYHDEFTVEIEVALCEVRHSGGSGRAFATLRVHCDVRLPSKKVIHSFDAEGSSGEGALNEDGTGVGPGVLWVAAADLATKIARELQSEQVRRDYPPQATVKLRSTETGMPPPPGTKTPKYDVGGVWGEYKAVVRLPGGAN